MRYIHRYALMTGAVIAVLLTAAPSARAADLALLPTITRGDLVRLAAQKKATVIAVAADDAGFKRAHLPHAISYDAVRDGSAKLPKDKQSLIVLYCDADGRGRLDQAIADLRGRGYANLQRFSGGVRGWKRDGGDVEGSDPDAEDGPEGKNPKSKAEKE